MRKFFGFGTYAGNRFVTSITDVAIDAVAPGTTAVVETDDMLAEHIRASVLHATYPEHVLAVAFYGLADTHTLRVEAAVAKQPLPRVGLYPKNINPNARSIWDRTMQTEKYTRAMAFKTPIQVWVIANRYFKAACDNAGVHPYRDEHNKDFDLRDFVGWRLRLAKSRMEQIYRVLDQHSVVWKQHPWQWTKFESDKSDFYILAVKRVDIPPRSRAKIVKFLQHYEGYHDGDVHQVVTPDTSLYLDISKSKPVMNAELHIKIPRGLVLRTLQLEKTKAPDAEKRALHLLEALVKAWSHGDLKAVVAGVDDTASGMDLVRSVLDRWVRYPDAGVVGACTFPDFYSSVLCTCSDRERVLLQHTVATHRPALEYLHRFNSTARMNVVLAATAQLRTLEELKVYRRGYDEEDAEKSAIVLPVGSVLIPRKPEEGEEEQDYYVVMYPETLHMSQILLQPEQRQKCADIENSTKTFDGSVAAAFEMLVETFDSLPVVINDGARIVKSLGEQSTWPYSDSRVWLHHLNMKSTHPGLTFDIMDVSGTKHLVAIYSGVW